MKLLITLTFLVIILPNQQMEFSYHKSFVMLGSEVRKLIWSKGLRASPKNYHGNTTPSVVSRNSYEWRNITGSLPNWANVFTGTAEKNNDQHSRNLECFYLLQASTCTIGYDSHDENLTAAVRPQSISSPWGAVPQQAVANRTANLTAVTEIAVFALS